jgi:hypothetical protein
VSDTHTHTHNHANVYAHAHTHAHANAHANSNSNNHPNAYAHANANPDHYANANANTRPARGAGVIWYGHHAYGHLRPDRINFDNAGKYMRRSYKLQLAALNLANCDGHTYRLGHGNYPYTHDQFGFHYEWFGLVF